MSEPRGAMRALVDRWHTWSSRSINRKIFAAAVSVSAATLVVSVAHLARELVVAREFGRAVAVDAFLIALVLPSFAINLLGGALRDAFIPAYVGVREARGQRAATLFLRSMSTAVGAGLLLVTGALAFYGHHLIPVLGSGFDPEARALTVRMYRLLVPALVFIGVSRLWAAALNAQGRFLIVALAPVLTPLLCLLAVVSLGASLGITALAYGFVAGAVAEAVVMGAIMRRHGLAIGPYWDRAALATSGIGSQMPLLTLGSLIFSATIAVDQAMAAMLTPGSVAALGYGEKVPRLLMNLGASSLGTGVLPFLSEMVARRDFAAVRDTWRHFVRLVLLVGVPAVLLLLLGSDVVVRLLFERGEFSAVDTAVVSSVQAFYLLRPPLAMIGILFSHVLVSARRAGALAAISAVMFCANIGGNILFMRWIGVAGLALSSAVVAVGSTAAVVLCARGWVGRQESVSGSKPEALASAQ